MGKWKRTCAMAAMALLAVTAAQWQPTAGGMASLAAAGRQVGTQAELEQALGAPGALTIHLKSDITVSKCLRVRGNKVLSGGGTYRIRRKSVSGSTYKGTLLQMQGSVLRLRGVALSGSGKSNGVSGDINGKLIEVDTGTVVLESGAKLSANYNRSSLTDGGGGITVHTGGTAVMKSGSAIRDNLTITGGSGVRVEAGGMFVMEGGTIADNAVLGQREDTGFDGRGGAIHNRGITLIQGGVISGNAAAGYRAGGESYGGYGGAIYNQGTLTVSGGVIEKNKGDFAGGAIYTNESSTVSVEGGVIRANISPGQRGGGLYLSAAAAVSVTGGEICDNEAADGSQIFLSGNCTGKLTVRGGTVSGSGDAIYCNGGAVYIGGGAVSGERSGLRTKGISQIRDGSVQGGQYGVKFSAGSLSMSGSPTVSSVYLGEEQVIRVDGEIRMAAACELCPERYSEGQKIVHISSGEEPDRVRGSFSLRKKRRFTLETGADGLYIGREKYRVVFEANGGQGNMGEQWLYVDEEAKLPANSFWREGYGFVGWSKSPDAVKSPGDIPYRPECAVKNLGKDGAVVRLYALWVRQPTLASEYGELSFYEGEYVGEDILLGGMSARDECDGDLSKKVRIVKLVLPGGAEADPSEGLPTGAEGLGTGEIVYKVANSFGVGAEYRQTYEVLPNRAPEVNAPDRYFFSDEYPEDRRDALVADILSRISVADDVETERQMEENRTVLWGGLDVGVSGEYEVTVRMKDQYGHRFYMPEGVERQYGTGKVCERTFTVYVVERENGGARAEKDGFVRFISEEFGETLSADSVWRTEPYATELRRTFRKPEGEYEEVWAISGEDKRKIRQFAGERDNPFSAETNRDFIRKFAYMRTERDD